MTTMTETFVNRRERRFEVVADNDLDITVLRQGEERSAIRAEPIDLSPSGIKLSLAESLQFGESVELRFCSPSSDTDQTISAEVRWIRNEQQASVWKVGCLFAEPLDEELIDRLAFAGGIDRRQWHRFGCDISAQLRVPGAADALPIVVFDYSENGIRFTTGSSLEVGQPVLITLGELSDSFEIKAKTIWSRSVSSVFHYGCEVSGLQNGSRFRDWVNRTSSLKEAIRSTRPGNWWFTAGLVLFLVWLFLN